MNDNSDKNRELEKIKQECDFYKNILYVITGGLIVILTLFLIIGGGISIQYVITKWMFFAPSEKIFLLIAIPSVAYGIFKFFYFIWDLPKNLYLIHQNKKKKENELDKII